MSKIEINNVYKIFGPKPNQVLEMVKAGSGKDKILEKTGHTVGLDNVSLKIEEVKPLFAWDYRVQENQLL